MVALLKQTRAQAFGGSPFGSEPEPIAAPETRPASTAAPEKKPAAGMRVLSSEETKKPKIGPSLKDHVVVHVLEDLPPFAGLDTTYSLKKEDVVTLPRTIAEILVSRGKARIVEMPGVSV